jgi:hypothetical protein
MKKIYREIGLSTLIGALIAYLWLFNVGQVIYFISKILGMAQWPMYLNVLLICITSFLFGALVFLPRIIMPTSFRKIAAISTALGMFFTVPLLGIFISSFSSAVGQLSSYGFWSLIFGGILASSIKVPNAI